MIGTMLQLLVVKKIPFIQERESKKDYEDET